MTKTKLDCFQRVDFSTLVILLSICCVKNKRKWLQQETLFPWSTPCVDQRPREWTHHNHPSLSEKGHYSLRSLWRAKTHAWAIVHPVFLPLFWAILRALYMIAIRWTADAERALSGAEGLKGLVCFCLLFSASSCLRKQPSFPKKLSR